MKKICLIMTTLLCCYAVPAMADISLLSHFNEAATLDADYAAGSPTATTVDDPGTAGPDGELFSNTYFQQATDTQSLTYDGAGGNVGTIDGRTGGITVGFWFKCDTASHNGRAQLLTIQSATQPLDKLSVDIGGFGNGVVRARFYDSVSTPSQTLRTGIGDVPEHVWNYLAITIDFDNAEMGMHIYNRFGDNLNDVFYDGSNVLLPDNTSDIDVEVWHVYTEGATIKLGGDFFTSDITSLYFEEFSIDNTVLTATEIADRVADMVAGNELTEPATSLLAGDANRDGVVSAGDYASVQSNFGSTGDPGILGDANGDGVVSAGDYASVQSNFGNTAATLIVPEPATLVILMIGVSGIIRAKKGVCV